MHLTPALGAGGPVSAGPLFRLPPPRSSAPKSRETIPPPVALATFAQEQRRLSRMRRGPRRSPATAQGQTGPAAVHQAAYPAARGRVLRHRPAPAALESHRRRQDPAALPPEALADRRRQQHRDRAARRGQQGTLQPGDRQRDRTARRDRQGGRKPAPEARPGGREAQGAADPPGRRAAAPGRRPISTRTRTSRPRPPGCWPLPRRSTATRSPPRKC